MSVLNILSGKDLRKFESPPVFTAESRPGYFMVTPDVRRALGSIADDMDRIGFLVQLGYFRATGRFFVASMFRKRDIRYAQAALSVYGNVHLENYDNATAFRHRKLILKLLDWRSYDEHGIELLRSHVGLLVAQQRQPREILLEALDLCWKQHVEIPSYPTLAGVIGDAFNTFEKGLLSQLQACLTPSHREVLEELLVPHENQPNERARITDLKQIDQSLSAQKVHHSVLLFQELTGYAEEFFPVYQQLRITDAACKYFGQWVRKAQTFQVRRFASPNKAYLHVLCFLRDQHMVRHDLLVDILFRCVATARNGLRKSMLLEDASRRKQRLDAIRSLRKAHLNSRQMVRHIALIVRDADIGASEQVSKIERLLSDYEAQQAEDETEEFLSASDLVLRREEQQADYYDAAESQSRRLQRRLARLLGALCFDAETSDPRILAAVKHFQKTKGVVGKRPPTDFLSEEERFQCVCTEKGFRASLYKALLLFHVNDAIKSGHLNLRYSYRYRAVQSYLITDGDWKRNRDRYLNMANLREHQDVTRVLDDLRTALDIRYSKANAGLDGTNAFLTLDPRGRAKVRTPRTDFDVREFVPAVLSERGVIPIIQVLRETNGATNFVDRFTHFSVKHSKMNPSPETILAGIMGIGCNIGVRRMASISAGISEDHLRNTINWFFSVKNLRAANDCLTQMIDRMALARLFDRQPDYRHSSSDGRKISVAVESLHASHSFKYFGHDKGVSMYSFIDERHRLFHSTVISSSDREAAFVLDGLLLNDAPGKRIHSTDSHGYTECLFAATHFLEVAFAPRLKNIGRQNIYAFSARSTYERRGYQILPSRTINVRVIQDNWDDILRLIASIRLKQTTASQIFQRLSSYAKDHPLYRALKEFGRIIKSQYILTYFDDLELRQSVEKMLSRAELSNRFSNAVFFANGREFQVGTLEEQETAALCNSIIQNAIVLWNYFYLSQLVTAEPDPGQRQQLLSAIQSGSVLAWRHINLQGEYDFTQQPANDSEFDLEKILALRIDLPNE